MGTTPARLVRPNIGLIPTTPMLFAWPKVEPSVSAPTDPAAKLAETAAPEPELEPEGFVSMIWGLLHCPPRPDQPLVAGEPRQYAHSLSVVLPMMTAPAA